MIEINRKSVTINDGDKHYIKGGDNYVEDLKKLAIEHSEKLSEYRKQSNELIKEAAKRDDDKTLEHLIEDRTYVESELIY